MNKFKFLLITILFFIEYFLFFGNHGILELNKLNKFIKQQKNINEKIKITNNNLLKEIFLLQKNNEITEEYMRNNIGLIKNGEVFYFLI